MRWRWHGIIFMLSFITSWLLFAIVWYSIAFVHNDLDGQIVEIPRKHEQIIEVKKLFLQKSIHFMDELMKNYSEINEFAKNLQLKINETNVVETKHVPCVSGLHDYTSAILYSIETQHTIGYGLRHITEQCSFAIGLFMVQSCFGILIQALFAGVILAKISRPNKRKLTIIFSHNAVVSKRDGKLCFMIKLGNLRMSQLSDARIKMLMVKSRRTDEGEFIPFQSYEMKVGFEGSLNDSVFFPWPKTIEHIIDEDSPFYEYCHQPSRSKYSNEEKEPTEMENGNMSNLRVSPTNQSNYEELVVKNEDYEIVVILEGNIETTGASCHIRTSYLPQEILFGYRFTPVYPKFTNYEYSFDYSEFDQVEPFQYDLMHLNVAYLNRDLNYVFDAQKEEKKERLSVTRIREGSQTERLTGYGLVSRQKSVKVDTCAHV
jgi:potassium inwardly-rectifying channel subfamily J